MVRHRLASFDAPPVLDVHQSRSGCARLARRLATLSRQKLHESLGFTQVPWVMSASGFVLAADVVTRTVLPIEGRPRGYCLARLLGRAPAARGLGRNTSLPPWPLAVRLDLQKTWDALQQPVKGEGNEEISTKVGEPVQTEERDGGSSAGRSQVAWATAGVSTTRPLRAAWCLPG